MSAQMIRVWIDQHMEELKCCTHELTKLEDEVSQAIGKIKEKYNPRISELKETINDLDRKIKRLSKAYKHILFDGTDKCELSQGILFYGKEQKVRIPRDALEKIKEQGWLEGIKTVESINRPVVEKWTDERLAVIGATRLHKEIFSYELKM